MWPHRRFPPRGKCQGEEGTSSSGALAGGAGIAGAVVYWLVLSLGAPPPAAQAAEIKVMSTVALTPTLDEVKGKYESSSGNTLAIVYSVIADLKKRIETGETADVMILSRAALDDLQGQGKVATGSIVNLGKSYVAIGIRAGAPKPDISTVDKLKAALLATKSISYADPAKGGASGVYFAKVLDRLGIADQMRSKTILVPGAEAGQLVARGEVEMAVAQASEIAAVPQTQVVGPLPGELNSEIVFSAGVGATSKDGAAASSLIQFLASPATAAVLKSKGMDPP
jgi:molybdate transport system substrate-binding protein